MNVEQILVLLRRPGPNQSHDPLEVPPTWNGEAGLSDIRVLSCSILQDTEYRVIV